MSLAVALASKYRCNACITALARCGRWRQALDVLDGMRRAAAEAYANGDLGAGPKGRELIVPDVFSYSAAITACGNAGQRRRALALLSDMRAEGVRPNVSCFFYGCKQLTMVATSLREDM